ncbi:hypothetical protein Tco_1008402 [Tanacetum coccineum]
MVTSMGIFHSKTNTLRAAPSMDLGQRQHLTRSKSTFSPLPRLYCQDMCYNEEKADQNDKEPEDKRVLLAFLVAKLKLNVDEDKKIQKQLKKENTSLTQEIENYKLDLKYYKIELERNKTF